MSVVLANTSVCDRQTDRRQSDGQTNGHMESRKPIAVSHYMLTALKTIGSVFKTRCTNTAFLGK